MTQLNNNCPYREQRCVDVGCDCPKYLAYVDANDQTKVDEALALRNFDQRKPTWNLIMDMQRSFAVSLHKVDGLTKDEVDHWVNAYLVCIDDEVREVREHLNVYGDGASNDNTAELKKEVIDIVHFMMDLFIVGGASADDIAAKYVDMYGSDALDGDLLDYAYVNQAGAVLDYLGASEDTRDVAILKASCRLLDASASVRQQISWKHWKKPAESIDFDKLNTAFAEVFHEFTNLCTLTLARGELRDIYVRKNVENIFRQQHGY